MPSTEERFSADPPEDQSGLGTSVNQGLPTDAKADESLRLVTRAKAGDEDAVERLWTLHESELHVYLSRYLRDPRDVAEVAQEVFIRMLRALPEYEPNGTPFRYWLFRIARNHAIDVLRREKHSRVED